MRKRRNLPIEKQDSSPHKGDIGLKIARPQAGTATCLKGHEPWGPANTRGWGQWEWAVTCVDQPML